MIRLAVMLFTVIGFAGTVIAQELPSWIRSSEVQQDPPPAPPTPPPDPPLVPIDGGLLWLALAGGGYAAYRLSSARGES